MTPFIPFVCVCVFATLDIFSTPVYPKYMALLLAALPSPLNWLHFTHNDTFERVSYNSTFSLRYLIHAVILWCASLRTTFVTSSNEYKMRTTERMRRDTPSKKNTHFYFENLICESVTQERKKMRCRLETFHTHRCETRKWAEKKMFILR